MRTRRRRRREEEEVNRRRMNMRRRRGKRIRVHFEGYRKPCRRAALHGKQTDLK